MALLFEQVGRDRGVHAAAQAHHDPLLLRHPCDYPSRPLAQVGSDCPWNSDNFAISSASSS